MIKNCQQCKCLICGDVCPTCGFQVAERTIGHRDIAQLAKNVVLEVMAENDGKHGMAWLTRQDHVDLKHIMAHLCKFQVGDDSEPHLKHSLTRLAMMIARRGT